MRVGATQQERCATAFVGSPRFPGVLVRFRLLRPLSDAIGRSRVEVRVPDEDPTVAGAVRALVAEFPALKEEVMEDGRLSHLVNVYRNGQGVPIEDHDTHLVGDGDEITFLLPITGGCRRP